MLMFHFIFFQYYRVMHYYLGV